MYTRTRVCRQVKSMLGKDAARSSRLIAIETDSTANHRDFTRLVGAFPVILPYRFHVFIQFRSEHLRSNIFDDGSASTVYVLGKTSRERRGSNTAARNWVDPRELRRAEEREETREFVILIPFISSTPFTGSSSSTNDNL